MPADALAEQLVGTLPVGRPGLFNPWRDVCAHDLPCNTPQAKLTRLAAHLACKPRFILCGEAPGYQGCRYSGIPFTSERQVVARALPRVACTDARLTSRRLPWSEPSATIVWRVLHELGLEHVTLLWNAVQLHPHQPGEAHTNRTPTDVELALGVPAMRMLVATFPAAKVVAVGRKAEGLLQGMHIAVVSQVRHPANGGASAFADGMRALARG